MKIQSLLFSLLFPIIFYSQTTVSITIRDTRGSKMSGVRTNVYCAENGVRVVKVTGSTGKVVFELTEKGVYEFNYLTEKPAFTFEVKGSGGTIGRSITYDPKGIYKKPVKIDRSKIAFKNVNQENVKFEKRSGTGSFTLLLENKSREAVENTKVAMVDAVGKTIYSSITDSKGKALFVIPLKRNFEIDVDGFKAFEFVKLKNSNGNWFEYTVSYEKTSVDQIVKNDTIKQNSITQTSGTSTHAYFEVFVIDYNGNPLESEPVYLKQLDSETVFESKTDKKGRVEYLLPNGHEYLVNLMHENNVRLIDLSKTEGYRRLRLSVRYRGSEAIEEMLAEREKQRLAMIEQAKLDSIRMIARLVEFEKNKKERERLQKEYDKRRREYKEKMKNTFTTSFNTSPIIEAKRPADYLKRTSTGYEFKFENQGPISTPVVVGDKLYVSPGYYCPKFYCFNAKTGSFIWGVSLAESGPSPAVYHDGVILINTESCTLYALSASSGKLLWSKWLSSYLYTSPTVVDGKVYATYKDHGFVLACFDVKTGAIEWQKRLDGDAIACPVVYKNEVHIATKEKEYTVFDAKNGTIKKEGIIHAVSSPTIKDGVIYMTILENGKELLATYSSSTLKLLKTHDVLTTEDGLSQARSLFNGMNFIGSRPIFYKENIYTLSGNYLRCFDPKTEKVVWKTEVGSTKNTQFPVIVNNVVYVGTNEGNILEINAINGRISKTHRLQGDITTHPVINNGIMYAGSEKESMRAIRVTNKENFSQWLGNGGHNAVFQ